MVEMIHHIGKIMGKHVIAEFVESEAILQDLRSIGIDYAQGYAVSMPQPFDGRVSPSADAGDLAPEDAENLRKLAG